MARKQRPDSPRDVTETPADQTDREGMESVGTAWGLSFLPAPYLGWISLVEMQRKNVDALAAVNRVAMEGALAVAECQRRVLLETWEQLVTSGQSLMDGTTAAAGPATTRIDAVNAAGERFLADIRAFSSLVAKLNCDVSDVVRGRLAEMLEEIGQLVSQTRS